MVQRRAAARRARAGDFRTGRGRASPDRVVSVRTRCTERTRAAARTRLRAVEPLAERGKRGRLRRPVLDTEQAAPRTPHCALGLITSGRRRSPTPSTPAPSQVAVAVGSAESSKTLRLRMVRIRASSVEVCQWKRLVDGPSRPRRTRMSERRDAGDLPRLDGSGAAGPPVLLSGQPSASDLYRLGRQRPLRSTAHRPREAALQSGGLSVGRAAVHELAPRQSRSRSGRIETFAASASTSSHRSSSPLHDALPRVRPGTTALALRR